MFLTNTRNILKIIDSSAFKNYSLELDFNFYFEEKRYFFMKKVGFAEAPAQMSLR